MQRHQPSLDRGMHARCNMNLLPGSAEINAGNTTQRVKAFASADVFVMPSLTDTFGIVIIEGLQCGTPVAAYPVTGPKDILEGTNGGVLNKDLKVAALEALKLNRDDCKEIAKKYTWENCAKIFLANTAPN